jgi:glycosyltransferase involved in cell wall biosynthesis
MARNMLIATLNHNLPELTDNLVNQLQRDTYFTKCELMVIDNGSSENLAQSTTHRLEQNVFFGGGFNVVLDYFLNETQHEWLYFLNKDLIFHGPAFLKTSIDNAIANNADVYSPSVINASIKQCHWKQMWNWGYGCRPVKWIDFQCPLIHRRVLEKVIQYPIELIYGWGLDFYTGCITETNGWKTVVDDKNTICHLNSQTFEQNKIDIGVTEFCRRAEKGLRDYFNNSEFNSLYSELRYHGENYNF